MSKKSHKKQEEKKELEIVDEQKQPCLRALQKKVRNINKKLTEIVQLQNKADLKPEQLEKVNRKEQLKQEKGKYLEFIQIYTEIANQNAQAIRSIQLNQLKEFASVLAAYEYGVSLKEPQIQNLQKLVKIINSPSSPDITLSERVDQLNIEITKISNNTKLKQTCLQFVANNLDKRVTVEQKNQSQSKSLSNKEQSKDLNNENNEKEPTIEKNIPEEPAVVKQQIKPEKVQETIQQSQESATIQDTQKENLNQENSDEKTEIKPEQANQKSRTGRRQYQKGRNQNGERKERGERKPYNRGEQKYNPKNNNQKNKNFKPKYTPKDPQEKQKDNTKSEQSDSEPQVREFKKDQRKNLEKQGFIVIGKPKPKAREQKEWHNHQHGRRNNPNINQP